MSLGINEQWQTQWAPGIVADGLRSAILAGKRYATRIERDLLKESFDLDETLDGLRKNSAAIADLVERLNDEAILRAGLFWCAPALATSLQPLASIPDIQPSRVRLRLILEGSVHASASEVQAPRTSADVREEGELCLAAWLGTKPPLTAARVRLRLDPAMTVKPPRLLADKARVLSMTRALDSLSESAA